jgi:hypothetical protein
MPLTRAQFLAEVARAFDAARTLQELDATWRRRVAGVHPWLCAELRAQVEQLHARRALILSFALD